MLKIPKKIKIGNLTFKVRKMTIDGEGEYYGRSNFTSQEIVLSTEIKGDKLNETFLHEIMHVILNTGKYYKESQDEKLVHFLAISIYQILKDNNLLHLTKNNKRVKK